MSASNVANTILAIAAVGDLLLSVTESLAEFQTLVARAQAEGRDITDEELADLTVRRRKAFDRLQGTA